MRWVPKLLAVAASSLPIGAWGHHGGTIARVDPVGEVAGGSEPGLGGDSTRLGLQVAYAYRAFGSVQDGTTSVEAPGSWIGMHLTVLEASLRLDTGTEFRLGLAGGWVRIDSPGAETGPNDVVGVGDTRLTVRQSMFRMLDWPDERFDIFVQGGVVVPTGRYEPDANVRVLSLETSPNGALDLVPLDTRASLGASAWWLTAGLSARARLLPELSVRAEVDWQTPVSDTVDAIRWGADLNLGLALTWSPDPRWHLTGDGRCRYHLPDQIRGNDGDPVEFGGLTGLYLASSVAHVLLEPSPEAWGLSVGARLELPVWQHVETVQAVSSLAMSLFFRLDGFLDGPDPDGDEERT